jgi:hypothetical protein
MDVQYQIKIPETTHRPLLFVCNLLVCETMKRYFIQVPGFFLSYKKKSLFLFTLSCLPMSEHNSDIDIDIVESPSATTPEVEIKLEHNEESDSLRDQASEEPITESRTLTKETRKLRKKKNFDSDNEEDATKKTKKSPAVSNRVRSPSIKKEQPMSTEEEFDNSSSSNANSSGKNKASKRLGRRVTSADVMNGDADLDELDTDDLLDEVDLLPALRQSYIDNFKKSTRKITTVRSPPAKKVRKSLLLADIFFFKKKS